ncbi:MAG: ABC transporter permease, partial [Bacteroidetes bacterium]|nr:ABC transporter permease [Bacteroidota bacterium]
MLRKNLKVGWRNIWKNKLSSLINIGGISIGLAVTALILFWIIDELSFDKFHTNIDQIYSVYEHQQYSEGQELYTGCTPFPLSNFLKTTFPEINKATTFYTFDKYPIKYNDKVFEEGPFIFTDNDFLEIFSFKIIEGDKDALTAPDNIVITRRIAQTLFGDEHPIGKIVKFNSEQAYTVGAIIESPGKNSSLNFNILVNKKYVVDNFGTNPESWNNNWPRTCILVADGTQHSELYEKLRNTCKENGQENTDLYLFPFEKERLYSYSGENNRILYIYLFITIGIIIILIACINFVNYSTAWAEQRRQEVGIRKTLGATKSLLSAQFLYEKGMMIFISVIIAALLVIILMPLFGRISDKDLSFSLLQNRYILLLLGGIVLTTLLLSVVYPAFYISTFNPAQVLKKRLKKQTGVFNFRGLLVVFQFTLSIGLIIYSIAISNQLKFVNNYDIGYNRDNLIYLSLMGDATSKHEVLAAEIENLTGVTSLAKADKLPFYGGNSSFGFDWEGKEPEKKVLINQMRVSPNYFETLGIQLTEGETFSPIFDKVINVEEQKRFEVVLNQEAIRSMEMKNPIGKYFGLGEIRAEIVGITNNFNFQTLKMGMEPMLLTPLIENPNVLIMRINSAEFIQTIDEIKNIWAEIIPQMNCEVGFFDDRLESMYNSETRISGLFKYFAFIAIFIACIGLFGLSVYATERRKKEIGIRKINGSKVSEILTLLNKAFVKWVVVSFVIACPAAWFVMQKWLQNFAYKTELSWWIFALAGILAMGIALITVSWQSWRAATRNPVE